MRYVEALIERTFVTFGKIYSVVSYDPQKDVITIIDDIAEESSFLMSYGRSPWFENISYKVRNKIIDDILYEES